MEFQFQKEFWPLWLYLIFEIVVVLIFLAWLFGDLKKIWHWLKGSRTTYFLDRRGYFISTPARLRTDKQRDHYNWRGNLMTDYWNSGSNIEVSRGSFRRRSAIYGPAAKNWKIAKASLGCNAQGGFGADWVDLVDRSSLPVERALELINKDDSSLQGLMIENARQRYRITELERELALSNENKDEALAVLRALEFKILDGKQRFRSPAAQEIRANIRFAFREMGTRSLVGCRVDKWRAKFSRPDSNILI